MIPKPHIISLVVAVAVAIALVIWRIGRHGVQQRTVRNVPGLAHSIPDELAEVRKNFTLSRWQRFKRSLNETAAVFGSSHSEHDPKCVCTHRLSEHFAFGPRACQDEECGCTGFREAKNA
jgi:hypothetical protein